MNLTDHIINVALLGTATRELITTDFPEELQETLRDIQAKAEDLLGRPMPVNFLYCTHSPAFVPQELL